jgi:hypothetical protein
MDGIKFDDLARRLARGHSRRAVLRGLVGGGAALVAARAGTMLADPADKVTVCHWDAALDAYVQLEVPPQAAAAHANHSEDLIDPDFTSDANCGDCNTVCVSPETCGGGGQPGVCGGVGGCTIDADCDDSDLCTTDSCDPLTGQCVHTPINCDDGFACTTNVCDPRFGCFSIVNCEVCQLCSGDLSACVPSPNGGECTPPDGDVGACLNGQCVPGLVGCDAFGCPAGLECCDDNICRNLNTDVDNCGTCGNVCLPTTSCQNGVCL